MAKKIWNLMYVVGNPAMFTKVTANADNPVLRSVALEAAERISKNGWRVWVEHHVTGERIFEGAIEIEHRTCESVSCGANLKQTVSASARPR